MVVKRKSFSPSSTVRGEPRLCPWSGDDGENDEVCRTSAPAFQRGRRGVSLACCGRRCRVVWRSCRHGGDVPSLVRRTAGRSAVARVTSIGLLAGSPSPITSVLLHGRKVGQRPPMQQNTGYTTRIHWARCGSGSGASEGLRPPCAPNTGRFRPISLRSGCQRRGHRGHVAAVSVTAAAHVVPLRSLSGPPVPAVSPRHAPCPPPTRTGPERTGGTAALGMAQPPVHPAPSKGEGPGGQAAMLNVG